MDIIEMATANTRSDMNAAVNMETSWGKSLEMLPQFTIKEIEQYRHLSGKTPESAIIKLWTEDENSKMNATLLLTVFSQNAKRVYFMSNDSIKPV